MEQVFITEEIEKAIRETPYGSTENIPTRDKKVIARLFNPYGVGVWYILEGTEDYDRPDEDFVNDCGHPVFGACSVGYYMELGCFSLTELRKFRNDNGLPLERDESVAPLQYTLGELMDQHSEE